MYNFNISIKKTDRKKTVSFQVERVLVKVLVPRHLDKIKLNKIIKSKSKIYYPGETSDVRRESNGERIAFFSIG